MYFPLNSIFDDVIRIEEPTGCSHINFDWYKEATVIVARFENLQSYPVIRSGREKTVLVLIATLLDHCT